MADVTEVTRLFAQLASSLHRPIEDSGELATAISSLALSLNLTPLSSSSPGTRVLDAALSLMCFKAPEVWSENVRCLVETIVTVLSSSVSCKVVRFGERIVNGNGVLMVGSSFSFTDSEKLIMSCLNILENLEGCGFSHSLLRSILRVAVSAPRYQSLFSLSSPYIERNELRCGGIRMLGSKLSCILTRESIIDTDEVPLRLFLWYLDPMTLKDDISKILFDHMRRPYLHLNKEFHERKSWRYIIICMVTSPTIFVETRVLLHNWFLVTGLAFVLELQIALVSSVLDVLSRPMWWGLTMEMGLKLPFSHAYFHYNHHNLLDILCRPISKESFLDLVRLIGILDAHNVNHLPSLQTSLSPDEGMYTNVKAKPTLVDSNSTWAMLMCFPCWFYFAAALAFCRKDSQQFFLSAFSTGGVQFEFGNDIELCQAAAMYLSMILNPFDQVSQNLLVDCIDEMARALPEQVKVVFESQQTHHSQTHSKLSISHSKKLRKPRALTSEKIPMAKVGLNASTTKILLQEFHRGSAKFHENNIAVSVAKSKDSLHTSCEQLVTKMTLGILLACPNFLDNEGCELLLHYAAVGEILEFEESQISRIECMGSRSYNNTGACADVSSSTRWSLRASLILNFLDIVEQMAYSMFDTEVAQLDYISQIKGKTVGYLVRCTRNIIKSRQGVQEKVGLVDILNRLVFWKKQGSEDFEGCQNLNDVIHDFEREVKIFDTPL